MKKVKTGAAAVLFAVCFFVLPAEGNANCLNCRGIANDAYCDNTVCQYIILNDFECNMFRSQEGNCTITIE